MSEAPVTIEVCDLGKSFPVFRRARDRLLALCSPAQRGAPLHALAEVSFSVGAGEVVGIVGRNGAGKTTLLKLLAGILDPSSGTLVVKGRVAAIFELGTGFHPEYSGRENILIGGMCLGLSRRQLLARSSEIIAFAELERAIDRPLKTYSSGMRARLAFAVATAQQPDVLMVDEALAAGDSLFVEKCYRRIRDMVRRGVTVLFVTHSLSTVYELCSRALLLHQGRLLADGSPLEIGHAYEEILAQGRRDETPTAPRVEAMSDSSALAEVLELRTTDSTGAETSILRHGDRYSIVVRVRLLRAICGVTVAFRLQTLSGTVVTGDNTLFHGRTLAGDAQAEFEVYFDFVNQLCDGTTVLRVGLAHHPDPFDRARCTILVLGARTCMLTSVGNPNNLGAFSLPTALRIVPDVDATRDEVPA